MNTHALTRHKKEIAPLKLVMTHGVFSFIIQVYYVSPRSSLTEGEQVFVRVRDEQRSASLPVHPEQFTIFGEGMKEAQLFPHGGHRLFGSEAQKIVQAPLFLK